MFDNMFGFFRSPYKYLRNDINRHHLTGDFRLSSGKMSKEYYDIAPLFLDYYSLDKVLAVMQDKYDSYDVVACMEMCPTPLLGALLHNGFCQVGLIVRKQPKAWGTQKLIEGDIPKKRPLSVLVIEDVTSTGQSVLKAVKALEGLGLTVTDIFTMVNRQEGCDELLKDYKFSWAFTKADLDEANRKNS